MTSLNDLFDAYREDARGALAAWANTDHDGWSAFVDGAAEEKYRNRYRRWLSGQVERFSADAIKAKRGEVRLFEPPESGVMIELRRTLILDGAEVSLLSLAGRAGAGALRQAMQRDLAPAKTTIARCRHGLALADHIEAESERIGRDVSVAEVIELRAAA